MIYRRLHILECARYTGIVFPISLVISTLFFLSRVFSELIDKALSIDALWYLTALLLVKYSPELLIASLFCGVLLACARSFQKREMDAWFSAGIGMRHFILPSLAFAFPIIIAIAVFSLLASPWARHTSRIINTTLSSKFDPETARPEEFHMLPGGRYVFFSPSGDSDKNPSKIFIAAADGPSHQVIFSSKLVGKDIHGIPNLTLSDSNFYRLPRSGVVSVIEKAFFETMIISLPIEILAYHNTNVYPTGNLRWNNVAEQAEIIRRINLPLAALVLTLLALFVSHIHPRMKSGKSSFIGLLLFTIYIKLLYFVDKQMEMEVISAWQALLLPPAGTFIASWALLASFHRKR